MSLCFGSEVNANPVQPGEYQPIPRGRVRADGLIHSFIPTISIAPFKSSTTKRRSRLQHGYCIGVSRMGGECRGKGKWRGSGKGRGILNKFHDFLYTSKLFVHFLVP